MEDTLNRKQLKLLMDVSNVLNSSVDIDHTIDSIMRETINAIDAADGGVLFLYDEKENVLLPKSSQGFRLHNIDNVRLAPGESMTGLAFLAKNCLVFPTQELIKKTTSSMNKTSFVELEKAIPHYPSAAICAPIIRDGKSIGVITLDCFYSNKEFTQEDINLVEAIAHQAAVALEKANLYKAKEEHLNEMQHLNEKMVEQNALLKRSIDIHSNLTDLVLHGEGLSSIMHYIYQNIGYHAILISELGHVMASTIDSPFTPAETQTLLNSLEEAANETNPISPIKLTCKQLGDVSVVLLPIGSAEGNLGVLALLADGEISEMILAALGHACAVISLEILKNQAAFDTEQTLKGEFIEELLSGNVDRAFFERAKHLNLSEKGHFTSFMLRFREFDVTNQYDNHLQRQMVVLIQKYIDENLHSGVAVAKNEQILVVISFEHPSARETREYQLNELLSYIKQQIKLKEWKTDIQCGIGRSYTHLTQLKKSFHEASKCIQFLRSYDLQIDELRYHDLGVQRLLLQNTKEELTDFVEETLGPLLQYERSKKTELLETLILYLDHNQNVKKTAEAMHIHLNTLAYRLKRVETILEVDFQDSRQFLDVHMALNLYQYLQKGAVGIPST
ncbi:transcriptional regulator [Alkalihalophilus pseudofirmus]|uniref:helix-turn-helix domain-containing protein n=1 Tax=Alkalihalophilus pseudofirmus TaxID=79885 RepID=UPI000952ADFC|nr:transcriptional regulator [Alkalihalophilus pseudofirmus]